MNLRARRRATQAASGRQPRRQAGGSPAQQALSHAHRSPNDSGTTEKPPPARRWGCAVHDGAHMQGKRVRGFESEGQYDRAHVYAEDEDGDGSRLVELFEDHAIAHQVRADHVLVGGGLPDEAVRLASGAGAGRADFDDVDLCVQHEDGDVYAWLAP